MPVPAAAPAKETAAGRCSVVLHCYGLNLVSWPPHFCRTDLCLGLRRARAAFERVGLACFDGSKLLAKLWRIFFALHGVGLSHLRIAHFLDGIGTVLRSSQRAFSAAIRLPDLSLCGWAQETATTAGPSHCFVEEVCATRRPYPNLATFRVMRFLRAGCDFNRTNFGAHPIGSER